LYFAEAPEVAQTYGRATTPGNRAFNSVTYNGQEFPAGSRDGEMLWDITIKGRKAVINNLQNQADRLATINPKESQNLLNRIEYAKTVNPDNVKIDAGNLYKVDIPDEAIPRMLDWDAPLSKQPQNVIDAIQGTRNMLPPNAIDDMGGDLSMLYDMSRNPDEFLGDLAAIGGRKDFGESLLRQQGIPGIRYLDGSSRNVGEGTSNFVLFDDQLPRILEINGQPTGLLSYADEAKKAQSGLLDIKQIEPRLPVRGGKADIAGSSGAAGSESLMVYLDEINSPSMIERMGKEKLIKTVNGNEITKSQYGSGRIIKRNESGEIIGALQYVKAPNSNEVILSNIYVRPDVRKKGIGTNLVDTLKKQFKNVQVDSSMTEDGGKFFGYSK
jgi:predicted GNAT family acetyltransferase